MDKFLGEVMKKKHTLLANGNFLQYPVNRESVSFTGTVREQASRSSSGFTTGSCSCTCCTS